MNFAQLALDYIATHARNIEADTVAHLKALAKHIENAFFEGIAEIKEDVTSEMTAVDAAVTEDAQIVEHAAEALVDPVPVSEPTPEAQAGTTVDVAAQDPQPEN